MAAAAIWRIGQPQNKIVVTFDSSKIQQKDEYPKDHLVTSFLSMIDNDKIPFTLSLSLSLSLSFSLYFSLSLSPSYDWS